MTDVRRARACGRHHVLRSVAPVSDQCWIACSQPCPSAAAPVPPTTQQPLSLPPSPPSEKTRDLCKLRLRLPGGLARLPHGHDQEAKGAAISRVASRDPSPLLLLFVSHAQGSSPGGSNVATLAETKSVGRNGRCSFPLQTNDSESRYVPETERERGGVFRGHSFLIHYARVPCKLVFVIGLN